MTTIEKLKEYGISVTARGENLDVSGLDSVSEGNVAIVNSLLEELRRNKARALDELYKPQENIVKAGYLRSEITKGILAGQEPYYLLMKALECISAMTDDSFFYAHNKQVMQDVYSIFGNDCAKAEEREAILQRLDKLMLSLEKEKDSRKRINIQMAIKEHESRIMALTS